MSKKYLGITVRRKDIAIIIIIIEFIVYMLICGAMGLNPARGLPIILFVMVVIGTWFTVKSKPKSENPK